MLNPIFWISVACLGAGAIVTWRRAGADEPRTREGPVPGYSYTDGSEVSLDEDRFSLALDRWRPVALETFHSPDRTRIVLTMHVDVDDEARADGFLREVARDVQTRSHARVVVVITDGESPVDVRYLYAPDRRGWSGEDTVSELSHRR